MSPLDLHIEELVLHGFWPGDSRAIGEAVQRELSLLFEAGGVPVSLTQPGIDRVDAGSLDFPRDAPPGVVGAQIAAAIHRSLGGTTGGARRSGAERR